MTSPAPASPRRPASAADPGAEAGRKAAGAGVAEVLRIEGGLVLASVWDGRGEPPAARLARWTASRGGGAAGWSPGWFYLAPDVESVLASARAAGRGGAGGADEAASGLPGAHQRVMRRLMPGPAVFVRAAGFVMGGARFGAAMCTGDAGTGAEVARAPGPMAAAEIVGEDGELVSEAGAAREVLRRAGVDAREGEIASGAGGVRSGPTVIELLPPGGPAGPVRIVRAGAYEERFVRKQLALNILFVCTGNTCRSPMAEAIAQALVGREGPGGVEVRVGSAGTGAGAGAPATPEGVVAVRELGLGSGMSGHRSRPLTRKMIAEADAVFTMGRSHRAAVLEMDPEAAEKTMVLDPSGSDVPDPIGMGQEVYTSTARRIMEMVRARLKELGT